MRSRRSWFLPCAIVVALLLSALLASDFLVRQYFGLRLATIEHRSRTLAWSAPDAASEDLRSSVAADLRGLDIALETLVPSDDGSGAPWTWDPDPCRVDPELIARVDPVFQELAQLLDRDTCCALLESPGALGVWETRLGHCRNWANLLCARALCACAREGDDAACARWLGRALDLMRLFDDGTQIGGAISMSCEGIVLSATRASLCGLRTDAGAMARELEPRLRLTRFGRDLADVVRRDSRATRQCLWRNASDPFPSVDMSCVAQELRDYTEMLAIAEQRRQPGFTPSPNALTSRPWYLKCLELQEQCTGLACAALLLAAEHQRAGAWPGSAPVIEGLDLRYAVSKESVSLAFPAADNVTLREWTWTR